MIPNILSILIILILVRITFNFYILPLREKESPESISRVVGKQLGAYTKNARLIILNRAPINHDILYYLTQERRELVEQNYTPFSPQKYLKHKKDLISIPADSMPSYRLSKSMQDTLYVSDSTFNRIKQKIAEERMQRRKYLPEGYYICTKTDLIRYKLTPIQFFDVTHEGLTLALAKK